MREARWHGSWCAAAVALAAGTFARVEPAHACGGLFCSGGSSTQAAFVNQTAERIVFVDHPDGTITAVIQIVYEGPADRFAWILPVPGVPEVKVSSNVVLDQLQQQTNPQYQITTQRQSCPSSVPSGGSCSCGVCAASPMAAAGLDAPPPPELGGAPVVVVEASGTIGPYDYTVLSVNPLALDPATVAIDWLAENEFDVGALGPDVLRPYLQDGLNLLAFRLTKSATAGSIRPVMLTYAGEQPSIPLRPTAVAAEDDMGVLVWVAADVRAVPITYSTVMLNEVLIDWFDPSNYAQVVSRAADEAGGRAFVTEWAGPLAITPPPGAADWDAFEQQVFADWQSLVSAANTSWGAWDGFADALRAATQLPEGVAFEAFARCVPALADPATPELEDCQDLLAPDEGDAPSVDAATFRERLHELVVEPVLTTVATIGSRPYATRFFTTLGPDEMTVDPVFDLNPDLPPVNNLHAATRTIPCGSGLAELPLPQGATVVTDAAGTTWPVTSDQLPAALQIIQHGTSGAGVVLVDDRASIEGKTFGVASCHGSFGPGGANGGDDVHAQVPGNAGTSAGAAGSSGGGRSQVNGGSASDEGCRAASGGAANTAWFGALLFAAWIMRRRRG